MWLEIWAKKVMALAGGKFTQGSSDFELKSGKLMWIMGIGVGHPGEAAPNGVSAITTL
jgi:hypothetical protein